MSSLSRSTYSDKTQNRYRTQSPPSKSSTEPRSRYSTGDKSRYSTGSRSGSRTGSRDKCSRPGPGVNYDIKCHRDLIPSFRDAPYHINILNVTGGDIEVHFYPEQSPCNTVGSCTWATTTASSRVYDTLDGRDIKNYSRLSSSTGLQNYHLLQVRLPMDLNGLPIWPTQKEKAGTSFWITLPGGARDAVQNMSKIEPNFNAGNVIYLNTSAVDGSNLNYYMEYYDYENPNATVSSACFNKIQGDSCPWAKAGDDLNLRCPSPKGISGNISAEQRNLYGCPYVGENLCAREKQRYNCHKIWDTKTKDTYETSDKNTTAWRKYLNAPKNKEKYTDTIPYGFCDSYSWAFDEQRFRNYGSDFKCYDTDKEGTVMDRLYESNPYNPLLSARKTKTGVMNLVVTDILSRTGSRPTFKEYPTPPVATPGPSPSPGPKPVPIPVPVGPVTQKCLDRVSYVRRNISQPAYTNLRNSATPDRPLLDHEIQNYINTCESYGDDGCPAVNLSTGVKLRGGCDKKSSSRK